MLRESPRSVVCRSNCSLNFCHSRTSGLDTLFFVGHPFLDVVPKASSDCGEKSMREILSTQPFGEVAATYSVLSETTLGSDSTCIIGLGGDEGFHA